MGMLCFGLSGGYTHVYSYQNSSNCALKTCAMCYKLYRDLKRASREQTMLLYIKSVIAKMNHSSEGLEDKFPRTQQNTETQDDEPSLGLAP